TSSLQAFSRRPHSAALHFARTSPCPPAVSRDREEPLRGEMQASHVLSPIRSNTTAHLNQTTAPSMGSHIPRSPPPFSSPTRALPSRHPPAFPPSSRTHRSTPAPLFLQSLESCPPQVRRELFKTHPEQSARAQTSTERTGVLSWLANYINQLSSAIHIAGVPLSESSAIRNLSA